MPKICNNPHSDTKSQSWFDGSMEFVLFGLEHIQPCSLKIRVVPLNHRVQKERWMELRKDKIMKLLKICIASISDSGLNF